MIAIIDYGMGNVGSVFNMLKKVGAEAMISNDAREIVQADKLILPGVGAYDHGMQNLQESGWVLFLNEAIKRNIPILGICLGMQLMCRSSEEGKLPGLGWVAADVRRFRFPKNPDLKIPHMGWNTISVEKFNPLLDQDAGAQRFYFVHSYHVVCDDVSDVLATADYGGEFVAAFQRGNIFGVQFHPEKSHRFGMALFERFLGLSAC